MAFCILVCFVGEFWQWWWLLLLKVMMMETRTVVVMLSVEKLQKGPQGKM